LADVYDDVKALDERLLTVMRQLAELARQEPAYARLLSIPGFGPVIAPAFIAAVGNGKQFRRGRDVSAWLGLVPKQHGTGGKVSLMHITKNGDKDLRTLLIHGARSVLISAHRHDDAKKHWLLGLKSRRGAHRTIVACANKLARIGWAILSGEADFDVNKAFKPRTPRPAAAA
jgi:transposase